MMLDNLDLEESVQRGTDYISQSRRRSRRMWAIIIFLSIITVILQIILNQTILGKMYQEESGNWLEMPSGFAAREIEVAEDGSIWAIDLFSAYLKRWDGSNWRVFSQNDYGTTTSSVEDFAFYEGKLWALVGNNLAVFDGANWQTYENVLPSDETVAIEAGAFGVAIADELGNIAILKDEEWLRYHTNDFLANRGDSEDSLHVTMISDGQFLWLSANGLGFYDGDSWSRISFYRNGTAIIGQDANNIWLDAGNMLIATDKFSGEQDLYNELETRISRENTVFHMEEWNGQLLFAVDNRIVEFGDGIWQTSNLDTSTIPFAGTINNFSFTDDGNLLVSVVDSNAIYETPNSIMALQASGMCLIPILLVLSILYYSNKSDKEIINRSALMRKRLPSLLPDMTEYVPLNSIQAKKSFNWKGTLWSLSSFVILVICSFFLIQNNYSILDIFLIVFVIWLILYLSGPYILQLMNPSLDRENRLYLIRVIFSVLGTFFILLLPTFAMIPLVRQGFLNEFVNANRVLIPILVLTYLYGSIVVMGYIRVLTPYHYVMNPFYAGDFDKGLKRIEDLRRLFPKDAQYLFQHGVILLELGRWQESEALWRELITEVQNGNYGFVSGCFINLASALQGQGRYDEAQVFLEAAIKINPEYSTAYRELALWYLDQEEYPTRALELTDALMKFTKKPRINLTAEHFMWVVNLMTRAYSFAATGQRELALATLEQAAKENDTHLIATGYYHLCAGHIYRVLGEKERAKSHYQEVINLNSDYSWRQFAQAGLNKLDASYS